MPAGPFLIALIAALVTPFIGLAQGSESGKVVREGRDRVAQIIGAPVTNSMGIELGRVADVSFDVADPTMFACEISTLSSASSVQALPAYSRKAWVFTLRPLPCYQLVRTRNLKPRPPQANLRWRRGSSSAAAATSSVKTSA